MTTATKSHPTKAQFDEVKMRLQSWNESQYFLIDGYLVSAKIRQIKMKLKIIVYVNGYARGKDVWHGKESNIAEITEIARRFYCLSKRGKSANEIKKWERVFGKKEAKKQGIYDKYCYADWFFSTATTFINHIKKNNDSIKILSLDEYELAMCGVTTEDKCHD